MSTIASPRDPSATPLSRRISNQPLTPTGSNRPSLDLPRSATASPGPSTPTASSLSAASAAAPPQNKRANRAALREYYNLKKQQAAAGAPSLEVTQHSEVPASELDATNFDAEAYVQKALEGSSLEELLRLYARVLGEVRALDAEKKALVYDNYSKLISATETIRKVCSAILAVGTRRGTHTFLTDARQYGSSESDGIDPRPGHCPDLLPGLLDPRIPPTERPATRFRR